MVEMGIFVRFMGEIISELDVKIWICMIMAMLLTFQLEFSGIIYFI